MDRLASRGFDRPDRCQDFSLFTKNHSDSDSGMQGDETPAVNRNVNTKKSLPQAEKKREKDIGG